MTLFKQLASSIVILFTAGFIDEAGRCHLQPALDFAKEIAQDTGITLHFHGNESSSNLAEGDILRSI